MSPRGASASGRASRSFQTSSRAEALRIDAGEPTVASDGLLVALPWPPTVNTYYRHVIVKGHVRVLISAKGRHYAKHVGLVMARLRDRAPQPPHAVTVALHAPTRARIDLDNRMKALLDSIYRALGMDDSVIDRLVVERGPVLAGGRALVLIQALTTARPAGEGE